MTSSNVRDLLVPSSHNLTFPTGFKVLSEEERTSALSSLLLYDILLKCRSASSLPSSNKWPGPTPSLLTEPGRWGFHAESDGSHLKSAGLKSNIPSSSSTRISTPLPRTAGRSHSTRALPALSPGSANSVNNPSDDAATLAQQRAKMNAASNAAHHISAPALAAVHGPASVHSGRPRSAITPLCKISPSSLGLPVHRASALRSPCPDSGASTNYPPLWATAGRA